MGQISSFLRFLARIRNIITTGIVPSERLWHGVVAAAAPGVTAQNALERQPEALQRTIFSESLEGVLRAGRRETAARRLERRDAQLVKLNQQDEWRRKNCLYFHLQEWGHVSGDNSELRQR